MMMIDNAVKRARRMETGFFTPAPPHLTEDIHQEILLRLPAESVLRCRAVCKAWRRITTDPSFIAAHARRRPAQAVLFTRLRTMSCENRLVVDLALDVIPVSGETAGWRRLIRYPDSWPSRKTVNNDEAPDEARRRRVIMPADCLPLASCEGVLLLKKETGFYLLCNPVTRQWAALPRLVDEIYHTVHDVEYAFYFHRPSGEYRLVCGYDTRSDDDQAWCVLSTGTSEPRRAYMHVEAGLEVPCLFITASPPVDLHDHLHWPPCWNGNLINGKTATTTTIATFDTIAETFQSMVGPATTSMLMKLFVMDERIVVADFGKQTHIDLWFLEDYGAERWERRHQVATPWGSHVSMPETWSMRSMAALADDQGNVMLGNHYGLVVYNVRRKTMTRVNSVATTRNNVVMSRYAFRESLVQLPRFSVPSKATNVPLIHFWH